MESHLIVPLILITLRMPLGYMIPLPFGGDSHGPSLHCHSLDFHSSFLMEPPQIVSSSINFRTLFTHLPKTTFEPVLNSLDTSHAAPEEVNFSAKGLVGTVQALQTSFSSPHSHPSHTGPTRSHKSSVTDD